MRIIGKNCLLLVSIEELFVHCQRVKKTLVLGLNLDKAGFFFLILPNSFGKQQESSLEEYIQLSVMMQQHNNHNNK